MPLHPFRLVSLPAAVLTVIVRRIIDSYTIIEPVVRRPDFWATVLAYDPFPDHHVYMYAFGIAVGLAVYNARGRPILGRIRQTLNRHTNRICRRRARPVTCRAANQALRERLSRSYNAPTLLEELVNQQDIPATEEEPVVMILHDNRAAERCSSTSSSSRAPPTMADESSAMQVDACESDMSVSSESGASEESAPSGATHSTRTGGDSSVPPASTSTTHSGSHETTDGCSQRSGIAERLRRAQQRAPVAARGRSRRTASGPAWRHSRLRRNAQATRSQGAVLPEEDHADRAPSAVAAIVPSELDIDEFALPDVQPCPAGRRGRRAGKPTQSPVRSRSPRKHTRR